MPRTRSVLAAAARVLATSALISRAMQAGIEAAAPPHGRMVEVGGVRLHVVSRGARRDGRPAMLMIHGLAGTARNFTMRLTELLDDAHEIHVVDRPGAGYSDDIGPKGSLAAQAGLVVRLIETLGLDRPLLVGHSLGGALSLQVALDHPGAIRGAALIAPATHTLRSPEDAPWQRALLAPTPLGWLWTQTLAAPMSAPLSPFVTKHIFSPEPWPLSVGWKGGGFLALRPRSIAAAGRDLRAALDELPALSRRYAELSVPIHVLGAESDALVAPAQHATLLARASGMVRLTLVPGGHMLPITQPRLVAAWLRDVADDVADDVMENVAAEARPRPPTSPAP